MRIYDLIRYPQKPGLSPILDGLPNWYWLTQPPSSKVWPAVKLDSGINTSAVKGSKRIPFLALRSSPHRFGSATTPWEDVHRPDQGYSKFFGDAKPGSKAAVDYLGNQRMLEAFVLQNGDETSRIEAPPILIFEAVPEDGRVKGQVIFHGVGVITRAELVVQRESDKTKGQNKPFTNYSFEIAHLDLSTENETLDWRWINARRDPNIHLDDALEHAPKSWRNWVAKGSVGELRRNVVTRAIVSEAMQRPSSGSPEAMILEKIYAHYHGQKLRFEALAEFILSQIFEARGIDYRPGWITQGSGDGGIDFIGAIDLDPVGKLRASNQVLIGQAKCEKLEKGTNGLHVARLAARLRRGWIGAYVTTSWFSRSVQREILADRYPVVLVDGLRLAEVVRKYLQDNGLELQSLLSRLDEGYDKRLGYGDPEEVLTR
jgi:hypothetical protein